MKQNTNSRMVLLLIGGIPVTMILTATWLWYFVVHGDLDLRGALGTANRGTLVEPPRQLGAAALQDATGQAVDWSAAAPRWTMVIPGADENCDAACERSLYQTRQIRLAMGRDTDRLRRAYISADRPEQTALTAAILSDGQPTQGTDFAAYLQEEHPGLDTLQLDAADHRALFSEHAADQSVWYLVDPAGWVMMSYNKEVPYKDVITDLKFLLKNSGG